MNNLEERLTKLEEENKVLRACILGLAMDIHNDYRRQCMGGRSTEAPWVNTVAILSKFKTVQGYDELYATLFPKK